MRKVLISVAAIALIAGCKGKAPEPAATDAGLVAAVPTSQGEADLLVTTAQTSLQEAGSKPESIVDAAIAFGEALKWYEQSGDIDRTCEMQANIFLPTK